MTTDPFVVAQELSWHPPGQRVLGPLDLTVGPGELVVVVGPNGAGKSTLLRCLGGLLEPTGGQIRWRGDGGRPLARRELARRVAYLPQDRSPAIPLSVERLVVLSRYARWQGGSPGGEDLEAAREALRRVGLPAAAGRPFSSLSGGEQQMVLMAGAMAQEAQLWLLDEPTNHLDPRHQRDVVRLLQEVGRSPGHALLVATHDLDVAAAVATRIVALADGSIVADGLPAEVLIPSTLERLYGVPFLTVASGERPLVRPELGPTP